MKPGVYTDLSPGTQPSEGRRVRINSALIPSFGTVMDIDYEDVATSPRTYRGKVEIDNTIIGGFSLYAVTTGGTVEFKIWAAKTFPAEVDIDSDWEDVTTYYSGETLSGTSVDTEIPVLRQYGYRAMRVTCDVSSGSLEHTIEIHALKCRNGVDPDGSVQIAGFSEEPFGSGSFGT